MELAEFLQQTQSEVREEIGARLGETGEGYPYPEMVFAEIVMKHMDEIGMTAGEPEVCHYAAQVGNARLRLSGFALSEDSEQLDLFVSLYDGADSIQAISDSETKAAADQCLRFLAKCATGGVVKTMEEASDAYTLAVTIHRTYSELEQIRIYVVTDRQAKAKYFKEREVGGKTVKLEVMDIERLFRHWSEGKARDELIVNFEDVCGAPLSCVYVPGEALDYDYALTAIPGEALRFVYEKYGARLLEANVRSFLSTTGKVNKGIRETLRDAPGRFMAYNNGIVVVADEISIGQAPDGAPGIVWLRGMQIVNGGQTTASIYFAKKKTPEIELSQVRVPAKVIVLKSRDAVAEEALIADVSRYANTQNAVKQSDLSANKPFHVQLETLALTTYCPDGVGRWFYERAAGSYATMLAREGTTPARLRHLREVVVPPSRKITKTDLAKYLNAWEQRPDWVCLGSQKNFERLMDMLSSANGQSVPGLPDVAAYKRIIAKAILFKKAHSIVRPMFPAFQANVAAYVVALVANRLGERLDLDRVWQRQSLSQELIQQIRSWATEVNDVLHRSAHGRMVSEWAKKAECWHIVRGEDYSTVSDGIPEFA
jgi:hypothetical protein